LQRGGLLNNRRLYRETFF